MPTIDFGTLDVYGGLTEDLPWTSTLFEADGQTPAALSLLDVLHFALSERTRGEPTSVLLDIDSEDYNDNGSMVVIDSRGTADPHTDASGQVHISGLDTDAIIAAWDEDVVEKFLVGELYYIDASETHPSAAKKIMARGVIHLHRSGAQ